MGAPRLDLLIKPQEYFREKVSNAAANQNLRMDANVEFYLVNLLCDFITPDKVETMMGELDTLQTPLAIMLKEAMEAPPSRQLRIYKYLGDSSLYISGFFQDYFNRKAFDIDYYITLGASAYGYVSDLMRDQHGDEHFSEIYNGLAHQFAELVEIVAEVSEVPGESDPVNLLAIYNRWTRSNSDRLRRELEKAGIKPVPTSTKIKQ